MTKSKSNGSAARQERKKAKFEAKKREREQQQQQDVVVPPVVRLDGVFSSPGPSARRLLPVVRSRKSRVLWRNIEVLSLIHGRSRW
jgi:hypothetical protein